MKLEVHTPSTVNAENNKELLKFFQHFHVNSSVNLKFDRGNDFFGLYKTQSDESCTYSLRSEKNNRIEAIASFVFRDVFEGGHVQKIAYATDLRVSNSRRAILEWTQHFLPVMEEVEKNHGVKNIFSVIDLTETTVINTFLRPRTMRRALPRYYLYRKFFLNTLHGRFPWAPSPLKSLRIRDGSDGNRDALMGYLKKKHLYRPFTSVWDEQSFDKKMSRLPGFKFSNFLIAFDHQDNVVGCLAPWSPQSVQRLIPYSYGLQAHNFRQFLKFGRLFGWTHPLTKPYSSTQIEAPLQFRYLTNIAVENEDVFESLLWSAYEKLEKNQFLAYAQIEQDFRTLPPTSWVAARLPYALYSILPPSQARPDFLHPSATLNPELEAFFL
jgi:hypothetical protein